MTERLKQQILILTTNTIKIALFVLLAIFFEKWWLSLLSILFMTYTDNSNN